MSVLAINYDLKTPGKDYTQLYAAIKSYVWCHIVDSCWLIDTTKSPGEVRDHLRSYVDNNDEVFVVRLHQHWATTFKDTSTEWLQSASRTWD